MNERMVRIFFVTAFFVLMGLGIWLTNLWLILFGIISIASLVYWNHLTYQERVVDTKEKFNKILAECNINNYEAFLGEDGMTGLAILESRGKIVFFNRNNLNEDFQPKPIHFSSIVESSIKEDGETVTKTSRGSQIGGALVGSALTGGLGVGSVIGALGAKQTSSETVSKVTLEIVIDDLNNPVHEVVCLISNTPLSKNEQPYKELFSNANKLHKSISVILNRNKLNTVNS
jgi:hypothetical protein